MQVQINSPKYRQKYENDKIRKEVLVVLVFSFTNFHFFI